MLRGIVRALHPYACDALSLHPPAHTQDTTTASIRSHLLPATSVVAATATLHIILATLAVNMHAADTVLPRWLMECCLLLAAARGSGSTAAMYAIFINTTSTIAMYRVHHKVAQMHAVERRTTVGRPAAPETLVVALQHLKWVESVDSPPECPRHRRKKNNEEAVSVVLVLYSSML